jgi:hypothetical protein
MVVCGDPIVSAMINKLTRDLQPLQRAMVGGWVGLFPPLQTVRLSMVAVIDSFFHCWLVGVIA